MKEIVSVGKGRHSRITCRLEETQWMISDRDRQRESSLLTMSFTRSCWSRFVTEWPSFGADKQLLLALDEEEDDALVGAMF